MCIYHTISATQPPKNTAVAMDKILITNMLLNKFCIIAIQKTSVVGCYCRSWLRLTHSSYCTHLCLFEIWFDYVRYMIWLH